MILDFRTRNFRSFKDEAVLSLVASSDRSLLESNTIGIDLPSTPRALRTAVIYGANAGGKSNFVRALHLMRGMVLESAVLPPNQTYNVQPFRFDETSRDEPTLFEVTLLLDGVRYQYGFEFTPTRIQSEWLLVYKNRKPQKWFDRKLDGEKDTYEFGPHLAGSKRTWQDATRPNALFLSTAVQLNSDALAPLYQWFFRSLNVLLDGGQLPFEFSANMLLNKADERRITSLMASADIAISAISAEPRKAFRQTIRVDATNGASDSKLEEAELLMPKFRHTVGSVTAEFELNDESQGTQKLFALAGPLFDILEKGSVLVIDELDRSLHPLLVRQIIETFQNPVLNANGAQLIFTTHDTSQLDATLFRRDQIWFAEKDRNQQSTLVPLMDFSPRKGEALGRNYLGGRYGGVPILAGRLVDEPRHGA